jgi:hypothetical protein
MIPENAVWAKDLEMCKAIRETVALIVDPGLVVSDCKDETENYLGVPIYRGGPKQAKGRTNGRLWNARPPPPRTWDYFPAFVDS